MDVFALLADPVRRRMIEVLAQRERAAGDLGQIVSSEFGIGQPGVSNQLRTLREAGIVEAQAQGTRRIYRLVPGALDEASRWVDRYRALWPQRLDALDTELARGRREARGDSIHERTTDGPADAARTHRHG